MKHLIEAKNGLATQMTGMVEKAKAENRGFTVDERQTFENLVKAYDDAEASIKLADRSTEISAQLAQLKPSAIATLPIGGTGTATKEYNDEHSRVFASYLRNGTSGMPREEQQILARTRVQNAAGPQTTTPSSGGGYLIPVTMSDAVEVALKDYSGILGNCGTFTTTNGAQLNWPTLDDTAQEGELHIQNAAIGSNALAFGLGSFSAYTFDSNSILVPLDLIEDSAFDLDSLIVDAIGVRLGRKMNTVMTVGTGVGQPTGIVTALQAAGNVVTAAAGGATTVAYANLVATYHAVDIAYRNNPTAKWMMNDSTVAALKLLVDDNGRPLWLPGLAGFNSMQADTILGKPFCVNNDMPHLGASNYSIIWGDLSKFKVRRIKDSGVSVLRLDQLYLASLQIGFLAYCRADSNLISSGKSLAIFQNSAT